MTDRQKVLHAIEVLKVLDSRLDVCLTISSDCPTRTGMRSLKTLLEKKHKTDSKVDKEPSEDAKKLCRRLLDLILARKRNFRAPDVNKWASDMQKIIRLDKREPEHLADVIDWCQHDDFWQDNILSPSKLRKQLDRLELKMGRDKKWQRDQRLRKPKGSEKSAKDRYLEKLHAANQGDDEGCN